MKIKLKIVLLIIVGLMCFFSTSLIKYKMISEKLNDENESAELDESMLYNISELSTTNVFYHNVVEVKKDKENIFDKDILFWVEYDSSVEVGIDVKEIEIENKNNKLTILLPEAKVLDIKVEESSFNDDSFYFDPKTKKPKATEQQEALQKARHEIKLNIETNDYVLKSAKNQAKVMIENYIKEFSEKSGVEYTIKWK